LYKYSSPQASDDVFGSLETAIIDASYPVLQSLTSETVSPLANNIANILANKIPAEKLAKALDSTANTLLSIQSSYQDISIESCSTIPIPGVSPTLIRTQSRSSLRLFVADAWSSIFSTKAMAQRTGLLLRGNATILCLRCYTEEASQLVPFLPIILEQEYGPRAWNWFDVRAKDYLAEGVYDRRC
jgi:hypothetical protein